MERPQQAEPVDVSVLVVSYNTRALLRDCLRSIEATASGIRRETIVVDNASADGSADMVAREFPHVRLIRNAENRGFAAANNQAIRISRGRCLLLLNSDAVLLPGALHAMLRHMDAHPEVGIAGGRLLNPDGSFQWSFADFPTLLGEVLLLTKLARFVYSPTFPSYPPERSRQERLVDWVSGACLMARRTAVDAVGVLDEDYFMYTEETDWCYRMRRDGWLVGYVPEAKAVHWCGQSSRKVPERRRSMVYHSKWLFLRKHRGSRTAAVYRLVLGLTSAIKLIGWAAGCLTPDRTVRDQARQHVRSYAFLLNEL